VTTVGVRIEHSTCRVNPVSRNAFTAFLPVSRNAFTAFLGLPERLHGVPPQEESWQTDSMAATKAFIGS
jgi:hypothetical protein